LKPLYSPNKHHSPGLLVWNERGGTVIKTEKRKVLALHGIDLARGCKGGKKKKFYLNLGKRKNLPLGR